MKKNPNYEPEIDIKDMFYHILAKWRSIIVVIILCTAAFGGYGYLKTHVLNDGNDKEYEKELDRYNKEVEIYEKSNQRVDDIVDSYSKQIDDLNEYLEKSVRMNIDPQNEWVATCDFFVVVDKSVLEELPDSNVQDPADSLLGYYQSVFQEIAYDSEAQTIAGVSEKKYLNELVSWNISTGTNSFSISVIGKSEQQVRDILDFYTEKIDGEIKDMADSVMKHTLTQARDMAYMRVDQSLVTEKKNAVDTISSLRTSIAKARTEQLALVEPAEEAPAKPSGLKKYIIIGFLLGAFLAVGYHFIRFVTGNKLRNTDELQNLYDIPIYGVLPNTITRKPSKGIDKLIEKRRGKKNATERDIVCEQIACLISKELEGKKVMIVSSSDSERVNDFYNILSGKIGSKVSLSLAQNFVEESGSIDKINSADAVIITEIRDETNIDDIDRMGEILDISGSSVKGYVVL